MDSRVKDFIGQVAYNVVGLDIALFFQANPATFDTAAGLALRLHRKGEEIQPALDRLLAAGALEISARGEGRYHVYSLCREPVTWRLLCLVSEAYLEESETRKDIVRMLVRQQMEAGNAAERPAGNGGE
jgi:hypothetical protein